jgi:predicted ATP-dependent endonuclease of OLD family
MVFSITVNTKPIEDRLSAILAERRQIEQQLDATKTDSVEQKRANLFIEMENLKLVLSAPERDYQAYLENLRGWEAKRERILGSAEQVGSIRYLEMQLTELANLPKSLNDLQLQRNAKVLEIHLEKEKLRSYYSFYYGAVQEFLKDHPIAKSENFKLTFNVSIVQDGFLDTFLKYIDQRKLGPFAGVGEGSGSLKRLLDSTDFDSPDSALEFTHKLMEMMIEHDGKKIEIRDQLRQDVSLQALYDFIFSLSYLHPIYNLRWDQKALEQLSPGERGNLLLIFYLLVDRENIPLVIDQPEENLDNQTVYKILVPCIKDAKKRRQIVMVTHNPNLAVVCDAEQVIYSEIAKDKGNEVTYISGSIEDPVMNKKIIDVLEGTRPAFDKRDAKYLP